MKLQWTDKGVSDLARLHEFLSPINPKAAVQTVRSLTAAGGKLVDNPRLGERVDGYEPREVRRLLVGSYEMRYEIKGDTVIVLRLWHTRENR